MIYLPFSLGFDSTTFPSGFPASSGSAASEFCRKNQTLQELRHEMNNFLKVLKIKSVFSVYASIVFTFFCCLVMEKLKDKVLAC
jgi:hypothetical protein